MRGNVSFVRTRREGIQEKRTSTGTGMPIAGPATAWNDNDDFLQREGQPGRIDPQKAVTMYHRSAAGIDQPLPTDVRTPATLKVSPTRALRNNGDLTDLLLSSAHSITYFIR